jgi:hypothetical protein
MLFLVFSIWVSWHTYKLLVYMHEVPDLDAPKGLRRLDRYDELAEHVLGECACRVLCLAALAHVPINQAGGRTGRLLAMHV